MNSDEEPEFLERERKLRLKIKREEWFLEQQLQKEHEKRKLKMIEEYERKRTETLKNEQRSSQRSKNISPQQRKIFFSEHFKKFGTSKYSEDTIIDKKELHKIKVTIHTQSNVKDQTTLKKIESDIVNSDDIILPRKIGEGSCPIFKKINVAQAEEIEEKHTVTCVRKEQSVSVISKEQLRTDIDTCRYSANKKDPQYYRSHRLIRQQYEDRIIDNYKHKSRLKKREEKIINKKRDRSLNSHRSHSSSSSHNRRRKSYSSYYNNSTTSIVKDRSNYHRRSKSSSPINKYVREKRIDNYKDQSSSRTLSRFPFRASFIQSLSKNDPDKLCKRNDVSLESSIPNLPIYSPVYNCLFPESLQIFRRETAPIIWSIAPKFYPMPSFPPHAIRWRMLPPRFVNNISRAAYYSR